MIRRGRLIPLVAALLATAGCSVFSSGATTAPPPLERTTLRVGVGNAIDTAPLRIAVAAGSTSGSSRKQRSQRVNTGDGRSRQRASTPAARSVTTL
jgi:NitT/TauT family transport system substrate-binding protein